MKRAYTGLMAAAMALVAATATAQTVRTASATVAPVRAASVTVVPGSLPAPSLTDTARLVERYFNGLTTLQARFSQHVSGEGFASEGTFYLQRPRQFLWQYDTPVRQKIIGTGTAVYYVDQTRNQVTQLPMNAGLARLFSSKTLSLTQQGLRVTGVKATSGELTATLTLDPRVSKDEAGVKSITLTFTRLPAGLLELQRIEALDALGATTSVSFAEVKTGVAFNAKMFQFTPGVYQSRN